MTKTISDTYLKEQKRLHENDNYGRTARLYADTIKKILIDTNSSTLSDYGAGKKILNDAILATGYNKFTYYPYDPAFPEYGDPRPAEIVTCIDVMEHIEIDFLDSVLDDLKRITQKLCFLSIATRPARKELSDGRNAHLIQEPARWWLPKLCSRFDIEYMQLNPKQKGFIVICRSINFK